MIAVVIFTLLAIGQLITGTGLLCGLGIRLRPGLFFSLSILCGLLVYSFIPFLLQLFFIPLTSTAIFLSLVLVTLIFFYPIYRNRMRMAGFLRTVSCSIKLYEIPFILAVLFIVLISVWRCFYLPPTPRDLTSGPEVIAEYTIREHSMINSVFDVNLESTNNQFKPPFITSLQIIYKYAGFPFGQVWLSVLFISYLVFLFHAVREKMHRLIAWMLLILFLAIPEMYAYTFMALFDYSNALVFSLAIYFLLGYFQKEKTNQLVLSGLLLGFATYIRSETLVLAFLVVPGLLWHHVKKWDGLRTMTQRSLIFLFPSIIFYLLSVTIYINLYLPVSYEVEGLLNRELYNPGPFFTRFIDMNYELIFSATGVNHYAWFIFIFLVVVIFDAVYTDRWSRASRNWLYAILVIYLGLPLLGYLFPLMDLHNSTKRGLFKIFPLMLFYMGHAGLINGWSERLHRWELKGSRNGD